MSIQVYLDVLIFRIVGGQPEGTRQYLIKTINFIRRKFDFILYKF